MTLKFFKLCIKVYRVKKQDIKQKKIFESHTFDLRLSAKVHQALQPVETKQECAKLDKRLQ